MSRRERPAIGLAAQRELDAVESALREETVSPEHADLAELARALRAARPQARERFIEALDARAARGFERVHAGGHAGPRLASAPPRRLPRAGIGAWLRPSALLRPALGAGLVVLLLAAVAIPLALSGGPGTHARPASAVNDHLKAGREEAPALRAAPAEAAPVGPASSAGAAAARRVERAATLDVGVAPDAIQSTAQRVFSLISAFGGYVRQSNVSSGGAQGGASFDTRVPSSKLAGAIVALSRLGHVRSENEATNDVTGQYDSLTRARTELQAERAGVLRQLARATEAARADALKARLRALDQRLSSVQRLLQGLRARVDYTSLALSLTAEAGAGATAASSLTPGGAVRDAARVLDAALAVLVLAAAAVIPLGVLLIGGWVALARTRRHLREQALDAR